VGSIRNFLSVYQMGHPSITILYGSETGNSQEFAQVLGRKCLYLSLNTVVSSLDNFDLKRLLDVKLLVVICSTTGQGDIPRNGKKFWKFMLKKGLPSDLLSHLSFTTFGLGDSSYAKFNYAIRKIHKRLIQLGAHEFSDRAESDEQSPEGNEGYYAEWERRLLEKIKKLSHHEIDPNTLLPPMNGIVPQTSKFKKITDNVKEVALTRSDLITGIIGANERITSPDHFQDVRRLVIKDPSNSLEYKPGDTVALYPSNDPKDVESLIEDQDWQNIADFPLIIDGPTPTIEGGLVKKLTLRSLLTHHLDIMSIPRRSFFMIAHHFSTDEREREKLYEFSLIENIDALYDYANRPRRSILETILEFHSLHIPVQYVFDLIPTIKPRLFSISSNPSPSTVELTVAIVEYRTIIKRLRKGVCTRWVKELEENDRIKFSIHPNNVKFSSGPLIMVAPGTGIAPVKSIIEQRLELGLQDMYLFTGNRFHDKDFLYGDLWESLASKSQLQLFPSFSRDEKKSYVQDTLYAQSNLIFDLIYNKNATFYLCGSSGKMPIQVRITIETILEDHLGISNEESKSLCLELENKGRYIQETW